MSAQQITVRPSTVTYRLDRSFIYCEVSSILRYYILCWEHYIGLRWTGIQHQKTNSMIDTLVRYLQFGQFSFFSQSHRSPCPVISFSFKNFAQRNLLCANTNPSILLVLIKMRSGSHSTLSPLWLNFMFTVFFRNWNDGEVTLRVLPCKIVWTTFQEII